MRIIVIVLLLALWIPSAVQAEPTGGRVSILSLRPYSGGWIYVQVSSDALCSTNVFTFSVSEVNGKEMYAAALTALTNGKEVQLEVSNATGCTGFASRLQSIYLYK